jgi:acyl-CoA synthetase (AMP-forming)/AMP-acid ligase II
LLATVAAGGHAVMVESTFSMEPLIDAIQTHEVCILHGAPPLFARLSKLPWEPLRTLRTGFVAGAPCPPAVLERLDDSGMRVLNLYGMSELGAVACTRLSDPAAVRHTTVGRALGDCRVRINTEAGGELEVGGPCVTAGYYRQPELTAAAFRDGWFRTGDIAAMDDAGNLRIEGRAKDVVQTGGFNVFPGEVEALLLTHPQLLHAAVVGVPHPSMGESLVAFAVPVDGCAPSTADVLSFARAQIAGYKLPYRIYFVPELPLLPTGKPDRSMLQRWADDRTRLDN